MGQGKLTLMKVLMGTCNLYERISLMIFLFSIAACSAKQADFMSTLSPPTRTVSPFAETAIPPTSPLTPLIFTAQIQLRSATTGD